MGTNIAWLQASVNRKADNPELGRLDWMDKGERKKDRSPWDSMAFQESFDSSPYMANKQSVSIEFVAYFMDSYIRGSFYVGMFVHTRKRAA